MDGSKGAGFVCVEHIDRLRQEQEDLRVQLRVVKQSVATLEKLHAETQARNYYRWRVTKATALVALLVTLAVIQEQHARTTAINDAVFHLAPYARVRASELSELQNHSGNTPLAICFVFGFPYLIFALVLYAVNTLDLGEDEPDPMGVMDDRDSLGGTDSEEDHVTDHPHDNNNQCTRTKNGVKVIGAGHSEDVSGQESDFSYQQIDAECVD